MTTEITMERQLKVLDEAVSNEMLAGIIDHTILTPWATKDDIHRLVDQAFEVGAASVCVNEGRVWDAAQYIEEKVRGLPTVSEKQDAVGAEFIGQQRTIPAVSSVIGFPFGDRDVYSKAGSAKSAMLQGATELDVVANIGLMRDRNYDAYRHDVAHFLGEVNRNKRRDRSYSVKVILECCYLAPEEIATGTRIVAEEAKKVPDIRVYVKTSTGFGTPKKGPVNKEIAGATLEDVTLMRDVIAETARGKYKVGIKAAGGIGNRETALMYMRAAGCVAQVGEFLKPEYQNLFRIGASATMKIAGKG